MKEEFPKSALIVVIFANFWHLPSQSLIGVEMKGLQLDLWAKGFQDGNYFDTMLILISATDDEDCLQKTSYKLWKLTPSQVTANQA